MKSFFRTLRRIAAAGSLLLLATSLTAQESPVIRVDITDIAVAGVSQPTVNEASGPAGTTITITSTALGTATVESFEHHFFVNGESIGKTTAAVTVAMADWTPPRPGVYFLTVEATDGSNTAVSPTVRYFATGATITSPLSHTVVPVGSSVTLRADATAGQASIATMEFFADGVSLGVDTSAPYSLNYTPGAAAGSTILLSVIATDSEGNTQTSVNTPITMVTANGAPPTVSIATPSNGSIIAVPSDPITITVTANDSDGRIERVETYVDGVQINADLDFPYSSDWTPVAVGSYGLSALAYDDKNNVVASDVVTVQISAPPAVSITSPATDTSISAGSSVVVRASASDSDGTVTLVQFFAAGEFIGQTDTAPYSVTWIPAEPGDDPSMTLIAIAVDNLGLSTSSAGVSVQVQGSGGSGGGSVVGAPPTVTLTSPSGGSTHAVNAPVLLQATAGDTDGNVTKVQFYANGELITSDDVYPFSTEWLPTSPADYALTARVTDNDGNVVESATTVVTVADLSGGLPSVSISSPSSGSSLQTGGDHSIIVAAQDSDGSVAEVQVFINGLPYTPSSTSSPYIFNWKPTSPGNYVLTARATDNGGNINTSAPVTVTVADASSAPPQVSVVSPLGSDTLVAGSSTSIIASAYDSDGQVVSVQFFVNGQIQGGADTQQPYVTAWTPGASGSYTLQAVAVDGSGNQSTSAPVTVMVIGNNAPNVVLSSPTTGTTVSAGSTVSLVAQASDSDGTVASVSFIANGVTVGSDASAPYTFDWVPGAAITYTVKARAIDNSGNVTDSAAITLNASDNLPPTVALTAPAVGGSAPIGTAVDLIASASDPDGTISSVSFYANGVLVGSATASPFQISWNPAVEGVYVLTARALDNGGNIATTPERFFAIVNVNEGDVESIYGGTYIAALDNEQGEFSMVRRGSTSASFYASSFDGSQTYAYDNIPVDTAGNFRLIANGATVIEGQFIGGSVTGTFKEGSALFVGTLQSASPAYDGPSGTLFGSLSGGGNSEVLLITAPNGELTVSIESSGTSDVGFGHIGSGGNFTILTAAGRTVTGTLESATGFVRGTVSGLGSFTGANSSAASVSDGFLRNLSTRGNVGSGENALIVGFVVNGASKQVLVRAIGPSLASHGVPGVVSNPMMSLFNASGMAIATNDDWATSPQVAAASGTVGAFALPSNSLDAALLMTLSPGTYTAQVTGVDGATGVGLVEIYDVDTLTPFSSQKMLNVSSRGLVSPGDAAMIAGIVINGTTPKRVLVRAVGPTLGPLGVQGYLKDPVLRLVRQDTGATVRENNDWEVGNSVSIVTDVAASIGASALLSGSKDAALLITLPPGVYTAIVETGDGSSGIALVEVYEVP